MRALQEQSQEVDIVTALNETMGGEKDARIAFDATAPQDLDPVMEQLDAADYSAMRLGQTQADYFLPREFWEKARSRCQPLIETISFALQNKVRVLLEEIQVGEAGVRNIDRRAEKLFQKCVEKIMAIPPEVRQSEPWRDSFAYIFVDHGLPREEERRTLIDSLVDILSGHREHSLFHQGISATEFRLTLDDLHSDNDRRQSLKGLVKSSIKNGLHYVQYTPAREEPFRLEDEEVWNQRPIPGTDYQVIDMVALARPQLDIGFEVIRI